MIWRSVVGMFTVMPLLAFGQTVQCTDVFMPGISSFDGNGTISFDNNAQVLGSDGVVNFNTISQNTNESCVQQQCQPSGELATALPLPPFLTSNSNTTININNNNGTLAAGNYGRVRVGNQDALTFTTNGGEYRMNELSVGNGGQVSFAPGDYYIDLLDISNNVTLTTNGGPVRLFINTADFEKDVENNTQINVGGNAADLTLIAYGDVVFSQNVQVRATLFADGDVLFQQNSSFSGAITARNVSLQENAEIIYDESAVSQTDFGGLCEPDSPDNEPQLLAQYPFDETTFSSGIADTSGNGNNGNAIGNISSILTPDNISCRAMAVPLNQSVGTQDALDSGIDLDDDLGPAGTIAFWYRSNQDWNDAPRNRQLFDASRENPDLYFYGVLNDDGQLEFGLEDEDDRDRRIRTGTLSFSAGEWVHLAFTYDIQANQYAIYVNGSAVNTSNDASQNLNGSFGEMPTLYFGDNRSGYFVDESSANSADGEMDEINVFQGVLDQAAIQALQNAAEPCDVDAQLVSYWPLDICSVDGSAGEIVDIEGGHNGRTVDGAGVLVDGRFCQASEFFGNGEHINIPHNPAFELSQGAVSLWFRTPNTNFNNDRGQGGQGLFSKDSQGNDDGGHLTIWLQQNASIRVRQQDAGNSSFDINTASIISNDTWHHLVYTWGSQGMRLYVDNDLVGSNSFTGGIQQNQNPIIFASNAWVTGNDVSEPEGLRDHFNGELDDLRLYATQIGADTVDELFNQSEIACTVCSSEVGFFGFEEANFSGQTTVENSVGAPEGVALGNVSPLLPEGEQISCQVLDVPSNTSENQIDAVDTGISPTQIGARGTLSFWYRSDVAWQQGGNRQLADASTRNSSNSDPLKYFFVQLRNDGRLRFTLEDSNDRGLQITTSSAYSFAADEWVHIAATWDLGTSQLQLFVNGVAQSVTLDDGGDLNGQISDLGNLVIGDNSSTYFTAGSSPNSANGQFDDVRIMSIVQSAAQVTSDLNSQAPCDQVNHYRLEYSATAFSCAAAPITVRACVDVSCSVESSQPAQVSFSATGQGSGTFIPTSLDVTGNAVTELRVTEAGSYNLEASGNPDAPTRCFIDGNEGPCGLTFAEVGLTVSWGNANAVEPIPDQTSQLPFLTNVVVQADTEGACAADLQDQNLEVAISCEQPNSCNAGQVQISGQDQAGQPENFVPLASVQFDEQGQAVITAGSLAYLDAGQIRLRVRNADNTAVGVSNSFVVRPLIVWEYVAASPLLAGADSQIRYQAIGAQNRVTRNYQPNNLQLRVIKTSPAAGSGVQGLLSLADGQISLSSQDTPGSFMDINQPALGFNEGTSSVLPIRYSEVGTVQVTLRDENYLGAGAIEARNQSLQNLATEIGPVIPAYFDVQANTPTLANTCNNTFTYIGQPFGFEVAPLLTFSARNVQGDITQNYGNSLHTWEVEGAALSATGFANASSYIGALNTVLAPTNTVLSGADDFDGTFTVMLLGTELNYSKIATPVAPFAGLVDMLVPSGFLDVSSQGHNICYQSNYPNGCEALPINSIGGVAMRYGRLNILNASGSELEPLRVPIQTEFFTGSGFAVNTDDNCTNLAGIAPSLFEQTSSPFAELGVSLTGTLVAGRPLDFEGLRIAPPGEGNVGQLLLRLQPNPGPGITWDDFLQFDWDGDGTFDFSQCGTSTTDCDYPAGLISFGQFRGNDRIIFWREIF